MLGVRGIREVQWPVWVVVPERTIHREPVESERRPPSMRRVRPPSGRLPACFRERAQGMDLPPSVIGPMAARAIATESQILPSDDAACMTALRASTGPRTAENIRTVDYEAGPIK